MPPLLALTGCTALVLILLWIEARSCPRPSWALLLPTAWLLIAASRPLGLWFLTGSADSFEDGSPTDRFVLTGFICAALLVLQRRLPRNNGRSAVPWGLVILYGFLALSITWSDHPYVSFKRWVRLIGAVPIALLIATEKDAIAALLRILRRVAYVLIPFSLVLIKYYPTLGCMYSRWSGTLMWNGVTLTKNALGQLCAMTIVSLVWANARRYNAGTRALTPLVTADAVIGLTALYLMVGAPSGAYSATSVAVLFLALVVVFALFRGRRQAPRLAVLFSALAVMGWLAMAFADSFAARASGMLGRDETFTGRTDLWALMLQDAASRPLLGTGFGAYFNTDNEFTARFGNEGHNGILDVYVETGVVGVAILLVYLATALLASKRALATSFDLGVLATAILLMNLCSNFTESLFLKSSSYLWTMMVVLTVMLGNSATSERRAAVSRLQQTNAPDGIPTHRSRNVERHRRGVASRPASRLSTAAGIVLRKDSRPR